MSASASAGEAGYLELIWRVMSLGEARETRNATTYSLFGERLEFNLDRFPLLTTKKMATRAIIEELLWFLRGETNATILAERGVHIWDGNTRREFLDSRGLVDYPEGEGGPIYGHQWRRYNAPWPPAAGAAAGIDQLRYILEELTRDPMSRRIVLNAWNPCQLSQMALPPCHMVYQFYVSAATGTLSCQMLARSQDIMLGTPFNIASTALLTYIIAAVMGLRPGKLILVAGDAHIYAEHLEGAKTQLERKPLPPPTLRILREAPPATSSVSEKIRWIETLRYEDFVIEDYESHPAIKMPMIA